MEESLDRVSLDRGLLDLARAVLEGPDGTESLTTTEVALMRYFLAHPRRVLGRQELLQKVWGYRGGVVSRAVDHAIKRLRAKIEVDRRSPRHIITVTGQGYRFEPSRNRPLQQPARTAHLAPPPRVPRDSFHGREDDLAWLDSVAETGGGVALVGTIGVGKSRLALQWATSRGEHLVVSLKGVEDDASLEQTLTLALESSGRSSDPDSLSQILAAGEIRTLVLEQADPALDLLGPWIRRWRSSGLTACLVITSCRYPDVSGLRLRHLKGLSSEDAVSLLKSRASTAGEPTEDEATLVSALGGNPRAIEYVAPLLSMSAPADLTRRWRSGSLKLRPRGSGASGYRPGLSEELGQVWGTLRPAEQVALVHCSVFESTFLASEMEELLEYEPGSAVEDPWEVLLSLTRRSVLFPVEGGAEQRLGVPPLVRHYVRACSPELSDGRSAATLSRDAKRRVAERMVAQPFPDAPIVLRDPSIPDWLAVLAWACDEPPATLGRAYVHASRRVLAFDRPELLAGAYEKIQSVSLPDGLQVKVSLALSRFAFQLLGPEATHHHARNAVEVGRRLGDHGTVSAAIRMLAGVARYQGDPVREEALLRDALAEVEDRPGWMLALAHSALGGSLVNWAKREEAEHHLAVAIDLFESLGDRFFAGRCQGRMANLRKAAGRYAQARVLYESALSSLGTVSSRPEFAACLMNYGNMLTDLGDIEGAESAYVRGIEVCEALKHHSQRGAILGNYGALLAKSGREDRARLLFEEAVRIHRRIGQYRFLAFVRVEQIEMELRSGQNLAAGDLLDELSKSIESIGLPALDVSYRPLRAIWLARRAQVTEAVDVLVPCPALFRQAALRKFKPRYLFAAGVVAVAKGDQDEAAAIRHDLQQTLQELNLADSVVLQRYLVDLDLAIAEAS